MIPPPPLFTADHADDPAAEINECYRCGYDLRTIDNTQPCPECGLLAERSRHLTDELHNTRPRWLGNLSRGVWLILLAIPLSIVIGIVVSAVDTVLVDSLALARLPRLIVWALLHDVPPALFLVGVILLTGRENYPPADKQDRILRRFLRIAAALPLIATVISQILNFIIYINYAAAGPFSGYMDRAVWIDLISWGLYILAALCVPPLLFERLRGLARRARSAHLHEHCRIVSVGSATSVIIIGALAAIIYNGDRLFYDRWSDRSQAPIILGTILFTLAFLFLLWSLYLLLRFAIAFHFAARALRRQWSFADRSSV